MRKEIAEALAAASSHDIASELLARLAAGVEMAEKNLARAITNAGDVHEASIAHRSMGGIGTEVERHFRAVVALVDGRVAREAASLFDRFQGIRQATREHLAVTRGERQAVRA